MIRPENNKEMILAIRAPQGSTLEIPLESQIKEMHDATLKKRDELL